MCEDFLLLCKYLFAYLFIDVESAFLSFCFYVVAQVTGT